MSTTSWIIIGVIVALVVWIIMIYNGLVAMRQRVNQAFADIDVQMKQRHDLSGALRQLFALSEAYPDLKANQNFQQLQGELTDIENKLAAARRFFNNAVQEYNTGIQQFPAAMIAGPFGFAPREFFDVGAEERKTLDQAPQVKF
jgi:LemA protein